jgi:uncharacterized MnhB-related membrane protein
VDSLILLAWAFDSFLVLGLFWLAWQALACPDLFRAIVLFVAFGLLMALVWTRLDAPDIALAEAAIGAGLTGALLLTALARLDAADRGYRQQEKFSEDDDRHSIPTPRNDS